MGFSVGPGPVKCIRRFRWVCLFCCQSHGHSLDLSFPSRKTLIVRTAPYWSPRCHPHSLPGAQSRPPSLPRCCFWRAPTAKREEALLPLFQPPRPQPFSSHTLPPSPPLTHHSSLEEQLKGHLLWDLRSQEACAKVCLCRWCSGPVQVCPAHTCVSGTHPAARLPLLCSSFPSPDAPRAKLLPVRRPE